MNKEIKPCPFCGSLFIEFGKTQAWDVWCNSCGVSYQFRGHEILEQWNTRAPLPVEQGKEVDATRACYCHWQMSSKTDSGWERVETMDNCPTHGTTQHANEGEDNRCPRCNGKVAIEGLLCGDCTKESLIRKP